MIERKSFNIGFWNLNMLFLINKGRSSLILTKMAFAVKELLPFTKLWILWGGVSVIIRSLKLVEYCYLFLCMSVAIYCVVYVTNYGNKVWFYLTWIDILRVYLLSFLGHILHRATVARRWDGYANQTNKFKHPIQ